MPHQPMLVLPNKMMMIRDDSFQVPGGGTRCTKVPYTWTTVYLMQYDVLRLADLRHKNFFPIPRLLSDTPCLEMPEMLYKQNVHSTTQAQLLSHTQRHHHCCFSPRISTPTYICLMYTVYASVHRTLHRLFKLFTPSHSRPAYINKLQQKGI